MAENVEKMPVDEDGDDVDGTEEAMDAEGNSDSDSSDSGDEDQLEQKIYELQQKVTENPYIYDLHTQLITTLRQAGELEQLRQAREKMSEIFPLSEELWLAWLRDEVPLATAEGDRSKMEKLFKQATEDYLSISVWLEYVQYAIGGMGAEDGMQNVRAVFEKSITAAGLHTSQGANIWEAYREFENAVLAGLMPQPGTVPTPEQEEAFAAQNKRVQNLFRRQLAVPLLDMEETLQEFEEWSGGQAESGVRQAYVKAVELLDRLRPLEAALLSAEPPRYKEYQALIEHELAHDDPARIQCVFERALQENCLHPDLWLQYTNYLVNKLRIPSLVLPVFERAVRNCPWSSQVWQGYLLAQERRGETFDTVKGTFERALTCGMATGSDYLLLWTGYCDYLRRRVDWQSDHTEQLKTLRTTLQRAVDHLMEHFGTEGDPTGSLRQFWATMEGKFCKNMEKARELWNSIMTEGHGSTARMWLEYYRLERMCGDNKHCRRLLQKALNSVTDWPESITEAYINFEREEGSLELYDLAVVKCEAQLKRINERREKAAQKEAMQEEQQKNQKSVKKILKKSEKQQHNQQQQQHKQQQHKSGIKSEVEMQAGQKRKFKEEFKTPPPPGFKGEPPPGYKGEPPTKKAKEEDHGILVQHDSSKDSRTAFVSNLSYSLEEDPIKEMFIKCGEVTEVRLVRNYKGKSKGYAYVEFKDEFCVLEALKLDRELIEGRPMYVSKCEDRSAARSKPQFKFAMEIEKNKLFVKGLPFTCNKEAVTNIFSQHGKVKDVRLVTYRSGSSKGIAYVEYETEDEATQAVMKTDGLLVGEHTLSVAISNPPPRKQPEARRGEEFERTPSLGSGKKETDQRGKVRTQVALVPRSVKRGPSSSTISADSNSTNGQQSDKSTAGMSNADFRSMLLQK
ncbi:squamous cell carcinoma antigen recognized by T-cells 3-like isoform X2 [Haliotis rufescens]|uniref:squamous cell carcinoma antigen recognized by T-cells 3-like isoform X2 n=1 Tax=Haliotis rufescens TaxID=6454 RepID=UPI00201FB2E9|nr:squamous cell carcinoma antigen recognized by T-cells 3-like isoform X2 [Haliotis rufescens]